MKRIILKTGFIFLLLFIVGMTCDNNLNFKECDLKDIVKSVSNKKGIIWYDSLSHSYSVFASIEGNFDSQDIGIPCDMPYSYKKEGLEILFSGNYFKCAEFSPTIPGQTYFYLELTSIKSLKNEQ
jgi:hypothetical protein